MKKLLSILAVFLSFSAHAAINFNDYTFSSYGTAQDQAGAVIVSVDGQSITLNGNIWKKVSYPYFITPETILSFELSGVSGELIGLGLDTDNAISLKKFFKLAGTDSSSRVTTLETSYGQKNGDMISYEIPIGRWSNGQYQNLFFICDDDATNACSATFKNVRLSEKKVSLDNSGHIIIGNSQKLETYAWLQDVKHTIVTTTNSIDISGNSWRALPLVPYSITPNTVLEFEFSSSSEGEIHAIGLDSSVNAKDKLRTFTVHGTQQWGIDASIYNQGTTANGILYQIPLGQHYNGFDANFLFFINDKDIGSPDANSHYTNIRIYESN